MKDSTAVVRSPSRAWPAMARIAAIVVATVGFACPTAVASASNPPSAAAGTSSDARQAAQPAPTNVEKALAYSRCMREHGVPTFPDPNSSGEIPKVSLREVDLPQFKAAEKACQHLLPPGTDDMFPPGEVQQLLIGMLRFSQCMRSHGVPNWPDPATDSEGRPEFPLEGVPGTSRSYWHQPRINHTIDECQYLLPPALGGVPIG